MGNIPGMPVPARPCRVVAIVWPRPWWMPHRLYVRWSEHFVRFGMCPDCADRTSGGVPAVGANVTPPTAPTTDSP